MTLVNEGALNGGISAKHYYGQKYNNKIYTLHFVTDDDIGEVNVV